MHTERLLCAVTIWEQRTIDAAAIWEPCSCVRGKSIPTRMSGVRTLGLVGAAVVGVLVGELLGALLGALVGEFVGAAVVGALVGELLGASLGALVGEFVGTGVACSQGDQRNCWDSGGGRTCVRTTRTTNSKIVAEVSDARGMMRRM